MSFQRVISGSGTSGSIMQMSSIRMRFACIYKPDFPEVQYLDSRRIVAIYSTGYASYYTTGYA